jgi:hypothetical protein
MKRILLTISIITFVGLFTQIIAQSVSGYVYNMDNQPIPYANVYIRELGSGTTTDDNGYYFMTLTTGGEFQMTISSLGYQTLNQAIVVKDTDLKKTIFLKTADLQLEEVTVRASKRDPAYAIIQNAIDNKKKYLKAVDSYKTEIYVKATEIIDRKERKKRQKEIDAAKKAEEEVEKEKADNFDVNSEQPNDPFAEQNKANQKLLNTLNMLEMQVTLNYEYPKNYKEQRTAYKTYGDKNGLFVPKFGETDFNFYRNMIRLTGIAENSVISPLSNTSILSYKFKLIDTKAEGSALVYKIKVIPRKSGNSTVSGYIYINDGLWNINRVDFDLPKGGMKFFDKMNFKQNYEAYQDSVWIIYRQEFSYETKVGRFKTFTGSTTMRYSDYQMNYEFPEKFFNNEVIITTKEAYDRDTAYWQTARPEALTIEQEKMVFLRDSIDAVVNSTEYQDSITAEFNKITPLEIIWEGVGWRNNEKKSEFSIGSIPSLIDFSPVGGWRAGPFANYFRRYENGKMVNYFGRASYGFKNKDLTGFLNAWHRYDPHHLGDISARIGRRFQSINSYDAFLNQLSVSNYILNSEAEIWHRTEIVNGLYIRTNLSFNDRKSIEDKVGNTQLEEWISTTEFGDDILIFDDYQAFITDIRLQYTPGQKYMTEPTRKVILGSDYPTFTLRHKRGWENVLSSDVRFDYLEFGINQDLLLGQFGHTIYNARIGDFLNTEKLQEIDLKRFRRSDPIWYSNPLYSFQTLDSNLSTTNLFFEVHAVHHFNGALINNIPLVKKLGVRLVAGGGYMWMKDNNFQHYEAMLGLERVFKLGARRRLKVGLFGAYGDGNYRPSGFEYKISIDVIDTWKKDWSF